MLNYSNSITLFSGKEQWTK